MFEHKERDEKSIIGTYNEGHREAKPSGWFAQGNWGS